MSTLIERRLTDPATGAMTEGSLLWVDDKAATIPEFRALIAALLSKSDVGLTNVDNTSDANKPVSAATAAAIAAIPLAGYVTAATGEPVWNSNVTGVPSLNPDGTVASYLQNDGVFRTLTYAYNSDGTLNTITSTNSANADTFVATYTYDAAGISTNEPGFV